MQILVDLVNHITAGINLLASQRVMVGIPSDKALREAGDKQPINNAALGYIHENGAPEANIPPRPFLIPGVESEKDRTIQTFKKAGKAALEGRREAVERLFHVAGLHNQSAVKRKINNGPFQALAPRTLAGRRARGRRGKKPLIDTGQLRNAINYVIRKSWRSE